MLIQDFNKLHEGRLEKFRPSLDNSFRSITKAAESLFFLKGLFHVRHHPHHIFPDMSHNISRPFAELATHACRSRHI